MAVRVSTYGRQIDKRGPLQKVGKRAAAIASTTRKPDKFDKPSFLDSVILGILRKVKGKKKSLPANRTQDITSRLKKAGLSKSDIQKLKGKKK